MEKTKRPVPSPEDVARRDSENPRWRIELILKRREQDKKTGFVPQYRDVGETTSSQQLDDLSVDGAEGCLSGDMQDASTVGVKATSITVSYTHLTLPTN